MSSLFGRRSPLDHAFPDDCRLALQKAAGEARRLGTPFVGPEHILLGLIALPDSEPNRLLTALGVKPTYVRGLVEAELAKSRSGTREGPALPYTSRAKVVLEASMKEARAAGGPVSSGYLLLGVIVESRSPAAQLLLRLGVTVQELRVLCHGSVRPRATLSIRIDDTSSTLIFEQIIHQIKESIATGQLQPGSRLPTVRQLADELGIAPGTVARAYSELEDSGVLVTDGARGTFVALPRRKAAPDEAKVPIRDLLRPAIVAAYHLGASANEVRAALEQAMMDIYPDAA